MITIHNEVTIDVGVLHEQTITLWLVSYGLPEEMDGPDYWPQVVEALRYFCAQQGWLLECGSDPYDEMSFDVFAPGFSLPLKGHKRG